jgi:thiol-disulfide isomerase/thioredoxin
MNRAILNSRWVLLVIIGTIAAQAIAQTKDRPASRPSAGQMPGLMMRFQALRDAIDSLKLSDEQKSKIESILSKAKEDMQAKMKDLQDASPQEKFQQLRPMFDELRQKIDDILNDEQKEMFAKKVEEIQQRFRGGGGQGAGGRMGQFGDRFREAVKKLDLSDDQKQKVKDVLDKAQKDFQELRQSSGGDMEKMRDKGRDILDEMRINLQQILTPEQQDKLRDLIAAGAGNGDGPAARPRPAPSQQRRAKPTTAPAASSMMMDGDDSGESNSKTKTAKAPADSGGGGVEVGQEAPNFELKKLDGRPVQLSYFKGRVLVLVFGSYSCPTFRHQASALEQLAKSHGNRADFLLVYTKEAHPKGGDREIARNREDGIEVEAPASDADRRALAKTAKDALHLTLPIAIDSLDNTTGKAYGAIPNGAVVIGKDGHVFAHQKWAEPVSLAGLIEQAAVVHPTKPE